MIQVFLILFSIITHASLSSEEWDNYSVDDVSFYMDEEAYNDTDDDYEQDEADCGCGCEIQDPLFNRFAVGIPVYNVVRKRQGGSRQTGTVYGFRACYDRIKRCGIYWGGEIWYGTGTLDGKNSRDDHLRSTFTDKQIEGRMGFTFQSLSPHHPSFTPFLGYGWFEEINKYRPPTEVSLKFSNGYEYIAVGFLSSFDITSWLQVGLNFKGRVMWKGAKCRVTDDPEFDDEEMAIGTRFNYRVEIPILYQNSDECYRFGAGLVPFLERRHYGGIENFPHDFFDTKLDIYGIILEGTFQF